MGDLLSFEPVDINNAEHRAQVRRYYVYMSLATAHLGGPLKFPMPLGQPAAYDELMLKRHAEAGHRMHIAFIKEDGKRVGFVQGKTFTKTLPEYGAVDHLFVEGTSRNKGIATAAMDYIETWIRRGGAKGAVMMVGKTNWPARRMYAARGWGPSTLAPQPSRTSDMWQKDFVVTNIEENALA